MPTVLLMLIEAIAQHQRPGRIELDFILQEQGAMNALGIAGDETAILQLLLAPFAAESDEVDVCQRQAQAAIDDVVGELLTWGRRNDTVGVALGALQRVAIGAQGAAAPGPVAAVGDGETLALDAIAGFIFHRCAASATGVAPAILQAVGVAEVDALRRVRGPAQDGAGALRVPAFDFRLGSVAVQGRVLAPSCLAAQ